jgi:hypothetical protein
MSKSIICQIIDLEAKSASELRQLHNQIMTKKCAANANKEYLRPRIAYSLTPISLI